MARSHLTPRISALCRAMCFVRPTPCPIKASAKKMRSMVLKWCSRLTPTLAIPPLSCSNRYSAKAVFIRHLPAFSRQFAIEHSGVEPDIITMAKSMAAGMPISAVVGTDKVMDASGANSLGGTYTGNPLSCAATLAVLDVFEEEDILGKSQALGDKLAARFSQWQEQFDCVDNIRNLGAMAAIDLVTDKASRTPDADLAAALCRTTREKGLILLSCGLYGNSIRFLMPVTIEDDILEEGLGIVETSLKELIGNKATV